MASQNFKLFYAEMMFKSSRADYLQLFMTWSIVQIVLTLEVNPSRFGFSTRKDHVVVVSTLAQAFNTPMECRRKRVKEGLNSLQLPENIAGSGQRSQRKRFVVPRRSGKGTWSWITELGKLK